MEISRKIILSFWSLAIKNIPTCFIISMFFIHTNVVTCFYQSFEFNFMLKFNNKKKNRNDLSFFGHKLNFPI